MASFLFLLKGIGNFHFVWAINSTSQFPRTNWGSSAQWKLKESNIAFSFYLSYVRMYVYVCLYVHKCNENIIFAAFWPECLSLYLL